MFASLPSKNLSAQLHAQESVEQIHFLCAEIAKYFGAPLPADPHSRFVTDVNDTIANSIYVIPEHKLFPQRDATIARIIHTDMSELLARVMCDYSSALQKYVDCAGADKEFHFEPADFYRKLFSAVVMNFKHELSKPGGYNLFQPVDPVFDVACKYLTFAPLTEEFLAECPSGTAFKIQKWWDAQQALLEQSHSVSL